MKTYHITREGKRTTISLPSLLNELLAFKLHAIPDEENAKKIVKNWLQEKVDMNTKHNQKKFSQWLQEETMLFIISDTETYRVWNNWKLSIKGYPSYIRKE